MKSIVLFLLLSFSSVTIADQKGKASWYGGKFHGRKTASGKIFNQWGMTAAHKSLKFGTKLKVTNLDNHKSVVVAVTDRGPYVKGRFLDLSKGAAAKLGMLNDNGVVNVSIHKVS